MFLRLNNCQTYIFLYPEPVNSYFGSNLETNTFCTEIRGLSGGVCDFPSIKRVPVVRNFWLVPWRKKYCNTDISVEFPKQEVSPRIIVRLNGEAVHLRCLSFHVVYVNKMARDTEHTKLS